MLGRRPAGSPGGRYLGLGEFSDFGEVPIFIDFIFLIDLYSGGFCVQIRRMLSCLLIQNYRPRSMH